MTGPATITDAVLWINQPKLMVERICGLTVLERQLFTLAKAGIRRVWIAAQQPPEAARLRLPEDLELQWVARDGDGPVECRPPYIGCSGDHFLRRQALEDILGKTYTGHVSFQDENKKSVVQILPFRGERVVQFEKLAMPAGACAAVHFGGDHRATVTWLLDGARKGQDGFMARVFDRRISLAATRWLLDTPLKPNHMTILSSLIGAAGALQFAQPGAGHAIAGAALVWLHSVLDGCDGELARLRYQESRFGGVLDFWGDNIVHMLLFSSLGLGVFRAGGGVSALILGLVAAAASFASAMITYRLSRRRETENGPFFKGMDFQPEATGTTKWLQKVETMLAQRDFIYLLFLAAFFGKIPLFLLAAGIGAPIFLVVLLYLTPQGGARQTEASKAPPPALEPSTSRGPKA